MRVSEVMHKAITIPGNMRVSEAVRMMDERGAEAVLVEEGFNVVGILTEKDIIKKIVARGQDPERMYANQIMTSPIITVGPNISITEASRIMDDHKIRRLVITDESGIAGMVTTTTLSRSLKYLSLNNLLKRNEYSRPDYFSKGL